MICLLTVWMGTAIAIYHGKRTVYLLPWFYRSKITEVSPGISDFCHRRRNRWRRASKTNEMWTKKHCVAVW